MQARLRPSAVILCVLAAGLLSTGCSTIHQTHSPKTADTLPSSSVSQGVSENPGLESRLQAASRRNRLKAGLQTQLDAVPTLFQTRSQVSDAPPAATVDATPVSPPKKFPKWNPIWWFGNVDDPVPPDWYLPGTRYRKMKWYCRNSLHNLTFYVIGIADKPFERVGRSAEKNFNPGGGWNWAVCKYKGVRLPFVSYQKGKFMCYLGWRERGNFGAKLNW